MLFAALTVGDAIAIVGVVAPVSGMISVAIIKMAPKRELAVAGGSAGAFASFSKTIDKRVGKIETEQAVAEERSKHIKSTLDRILKNQDMLEEKFDKLMANRAV